MFQGLRCFIEGGRPLHLTLTGSCIPMQQNREQVHVSTVVRTKEIKNISIPNRTNMLWKLRPQVEGEYFTGQDTFVVEPQSNKAYEISYYPMTMTTEGKKHTVRVTRGHIEHRQWQFVIRCIDIL